MEENRLLNYFDVGEGREFFKLLERNGCSVSPSLKFQLVLYFAANPLRDLSKLQYSLSGLKQYMESDEVSTVVATCPELVQYFALPYVSNPTHHPAFKEIFTSSWTKQLREQLATDLHNSMQKDQKVEVKKSTQDYEGLREEYERLVKVTSELVDCLNNEEQSGLSTDLLSMVSDVSQQLHSGQAARTSEPHHINAAKRRDDENNLLTTPDTARMGMYAVRRTLSDSPKRRKHLVRKRSQNNPTLPSSNSSSSHSMQGNHPVGSLVPADPKHRPVVASPTGKTQNSHVEIRAESSSCTPGGQSAPVNKNSKGRPNKVTEVSRTACSSSKSAAANRPGSASASAQKCVPKKYEMPSEVSADGTSLSLIDYAKLSEELLRNPKSRSSALLIQALRQQLTRNASMGMAREVVARFAEKDLLLLGKRRNSVIATILAQNEPNGDETKEQLARLLNAIASLHIGRSYLLSVSGGKELLSQVLLALRTRRMRGHAFEHMLATLQKLSIRGAVQRELIMNGALDWLISYIGSGATKATSKALSFNRLSPSVVEYGVAMIENLCLCPGSHSILLRFKDQYLQMMSDLLNSHSMLLPYLLRIFFTVFGRVVRIRQLAHERGEVEAQLKQIVQRSSPELQLQCRMILQLLSGEYTCASGWKDDAQQHDETALDDYMEADINSTDTLIPVMTEEFGEKLLLQRFGTSPILPLPTGLEKRPQLLMEGDMPGEVVDNRLKMAAGRMTDWNMRRPSQHPFPTTSTPENPKASVTKTERRYREDKSNLSASWGSCKVVHFEEAARTSSMASMMSHTTFVLENDRRKPLLADQDQFNAALSAFKVAATLQQQAQQGGLAGDNDQLIHQAAGARNVNVLDGGSAPVKTSTMSLAVAESRSRTTNTLTQSRAGDETRKPNAKSMSNFIRKASHTGEAGKDRRIGNKEQDRQTKFGQDEDYSAVFGAKPKIPRTPDSAACNGVDEIENKLH